MELGVDAIVQSPTTFGPDSAHPRPQESGAQPPVVSAASSGAPSTNRRRRSSKSASGTIIKRSASSPNVRKTLTPSEAAISSAMSLAEKRRNKLGYHRTSVACVHCRRRKIRCLLAPDDAQNRCSNCIRLKKECNFFPVDQQPPVERRPRAESKVDGRSADASTSASSSPSVTAGHSAEQDQFSPYPIMPLSAHPFSGSMGPLGATTMSPPGSAGPMPSPFEFPDHHRGSWDQHPYYETPGGSTVPDDQPQSGFWMRPEPPMTPSYSTYPSGHHNSIVHPIRESDGSYSPFPKADGWQAPRSMSYSHPEGSANYGPDNFNQIYQPELRHNSAEMPPPSLRNSASSSIASMSETPSIPQSGQMYHFVSGLGGVPTQSPKSLEFGGGGWYPDPSQLPKVREEEVQHHHLIEGPAMLYSAAGHH